MLTLNDGRSELWQWDTGRTLAVDADCSQVHFSNKAFGRSIDVDVVDGVAVIPDILLQTDKDLNVWAFVGTAENGYTKISKTFKVNRRNRPADYVFTPPDQTSLEEIKEKIDYLESIQDPDAIKNAVEDYLEQNPVEAPVQSVNGQTGTVELTAEDVGAISRDDLQEATNEALAQAKASGEFDGADGQPGTDGSPGSDGKSAYQYAVEGGYTGTEAEFAAKLTQEKFANPNALTFTGAVTGSYDGSEAVTVKIPGGGESVQADWNQNDETAADYVKNRPFYTGDPENVTVETEAATYAILEGFPVFAVGDTVTVNVDGVEHSLVAYNDDGYPTIGDPYSSIGGEEEQFGWQIYVDPEDNTVGFYATEAHTVSYVSIDYHKIDPKYLPVQRQRVAFTKSFYNDGALSDTMSDDEVLDSMVLNIPVLRSSFIKDKIVCSPDGDLYLRDQYVESGMFASGIEINSDTLTSETFELVMPYGDICMLNVKDIYTKTKCTVYFPMLNQSGSSSSVGTIANTFTQSVAYINGHLFAFCTSSLPISGTDRTITLTIKKIL